MVRSHARGTLGVGRSHGRRRQRQTRVGSLFQALKSSEHQRPLLVLGSIPARQIRQDHFAQRPLHRGVQEPAGSSGHAHLDAASLSQRLVARDEHLSRMNPAPFWLFNAGPASRLRRSVPSFHQRVTGGRTDGNL